MPIEELDAARLDWIEQEIRPAERLCMCGCGLKLKKPALTKRRFLPGHDAALKRALEEMAADGDEQAVRILVNAGWRPSVARRAVANKRASTTRQRQRVAA